MAKNKRFVYYEHKGADYILENPNTELDFIEMLGDCLEAEEIVDKLNELNDFKDNVFKVIDKKIEWHLLQAKKCRNQENIEKAIKFEEAVMTLNILKRDIEN